MQSILLRALRLSALACAVLAPPAHAQAGTASYPYGESRPLAGRYIVTFHAWVADPAAEAAALVGAHGGQLHHTYSHAIRGFAASLSDAAVRALGSNPRIQRIEQDQSVSLRQVSSPQEQATWGLDRVDQADLPLDTRYNFTQTGSGVYAFIVDTGVRATHVEFSGRMVAGYTAVNDGNGTNDCNGHGTHVAGTAAGTTWGVAKLASVVPVRVLDCRGSGTWSAVIAGVDWVAASTLRPAVANMSLGGGYSASVNSAVAGAVAKGVTFAVAAGNSNADACNSSPASEPTAITVAATTDTDSRASYSNWGSCVDLFAPGSGITSAWYTGDSATNTISGTSMASPHVAGAAALVLQANPGASPAGVTDAIRSGATANHVGSAGTGTPNLLLNALAASAPIVAPVIQTVAFQSMSGSGARSGGNWRATVAVTVRNVETGAVVPYATVSGSFSPGGSGQCTTGTAGICTITSSPLKWNSVASTTFTGTGIAGTNLRYDATQNAVTQIVIQRP